MHRDARLEMTNNSIRARVIIVGDEEQSDLEGETRLLSAFDAFVRVCHAHRHKFQPLTRPYFPATLSVSTAICFEREKDVETTSSRKPEILAHARAREKY